MSRHNQVNIVDRKRYNLAREFRRLAGGADASLAAHVAAADPHPGYQLEDVQLTSLANLTYAANALKSIRVNAGETGFELYTPVLDHGALTGLGDDDHSQYHNDARGDARYSQLGHSHTTDSGLITLSGTGTDITVPAGTKNIRLVFSAANASNNQLQVRLGTGVGIESTGYDQTCSNASGSTSTSVTTGFTFAVSTLSTNPHRGIALLTKLDDTADYWCFSSQASRAGLGTVDHGAGGKDLGGALTTLRIQAHNGTDNISGTARAFFEG